MRLTERDGYEFEKGRMLFQLTVYGWLAAAVAIFVGIVSVIHLFQFFTGTLPNPSTDWIKEYNSPEATKKRREEERRNPPRPRPAGPAG